MSMSRIVASTVTVAAGLALCPGCANVLGLDKYNEVTCSTGAPACVTAADCGPASPCMEPACNAGCCSTTPASGSCTLSGGMGVCGDPAGSMAGTCIGCNTSSDCSAGNVCVQNMCAPPSCTDKVKDGTETDVDCGGSCPPCVVGSACLAPADCMPNDCKNNVCVAASCSDGVQDGDETGVDCGGACPTRCGLNEGCKTPTDCATGVHGNPTCTAGKCGFACDTGFGACNGVVGCETDLTAPAHCGSCTVSCSAYCVSAICNDPIDIVGGYDHNCAILTDGSVYCWGVNTEGEVGDGTAGNNRIKPAKVTLPAPAVALGAGGIYLGLTPPYAADTCAVLNDGTVYCWGDNTYGQLGQGNTNAYVGPVKVGGGLSNVAKVAVGGAHVCAITANHQIYCWGRNAFGEVGNGSTTFVVSSPVLIQPGGAQYATAAVAAGTNFTCSVQTDKTVYCWGQNANGELGIGNQMDMHSPTAVPSLSGVTGITCGKAFACAWTGTHNYCWGRNQAGEIGVGMAAGTNVTTPTLVPGVPAATLMAAGYYHVMAITGSGTYAWGADGNGQLGDGQTTSIQWSPESVLAGTKFTKLSMSETSTCGLSTSGEQCWGSGTSGQLGDGGSMDSSVPVAVKW